MYKYDLWKSSINFQVMIIPTKVVKYALNRQIMKLNFQKIQNRNWIPAQSQITHNHFLPAHFPPLGLAHLGAAHPPRPWTQTHPDSC